MNTVSEQFELKFNASYKTVVSKLSYNDLV